ncbi:MAG: rRNA synthase [Chthoniobacter sp.]|jgi:23S rRNA pseudouridine1911/1915/1917 synthase|nr:rRNA synthase [Chthoniobacter sp.]
MPEFRVEKGDSGQRLDAFLAQKIPRLSRSRIQALIKTGHARMDGAAQKPGAKVKRDRVVSIEEPEPTNSTIEAEDIPLDVIYEDDEIVVINKPPGLVVHPAAGNAAHTLVNALLNHCRSLSGIGGERRPGIVHRLDKETSGCIVVAKNDAAHQSLARQFAARTVTKIYLALVSGHLKTKLGTMDAAIGRHPVHRKQMTVLARGRAAKTDYRVVQEIDPASLVECRLHTGRTHQIRVHLKHLGHPVLGDKLYAPKLARGFPRQMLHAWQLGFAHPATKLPVKFTAPLPDDFVKAGAAVLPHD